MMRRLMVLLLLLMACSNVQAAGSKNYCLDQQVNSEWAGILARSPDDQIVIRLFALRIGLCELVKRKVVALDKATEIFEHERNKAVNERKHELELEEGKSPKS